MEGLTLLYEVATSRLLGYLAIALAAAGGWLVVNAAGWGALGLWERIRLYRRSRRALYVMQVQRGTAALSEELLYGYPDLPWRALRIGLVIAGFLVLLPVLGFPGAGMAVVLNYAPLLLRRMLRREGQYRLRLRVRDFVDDLREAIAIHGSLGKALDALLMLYRDNVRDPLALALARRAAARTAQTAPDQVLQEMAQDLRSAEMREVADQVRLALAAGMDLTQALAAAADNLSEVIAAQVNMRLQAAPNSYVLPMVLFMFGPLMILMLYPVALRVVAMIAPG